MRLKYKLKNFTCYITFALYPATTLVACLVSALVINGLLAWGMFRLDTDSVAYDIFFALITGATASFFVSIVVELTNNYKHNKLAWYELQGYYQVITDYEVMKHILMHNTPRN